MSLYCVRSKFGSVLLVFLLVAGCVRYGPFIKPVVKFDKTTNTHIKTIALLRVDEPINFLRHDPPSKLGNKANIGCACLGGFLGPLGLATWAAGASVADSIQRKADKTRGENFREAFNSHHIQFGLAMAESLRHELTKKGFGFLYLKDQSLFTGEDQSLRNGAVLRDLNLSHIRTDADAILFVSLRSAGYSALGNKKGNYKPTVHAYARLIDSFSKKTIYSRIFLVDERSYGGKVEYMLPVEGHKYNSLDTLLKDINETAQGIIDCQRKIAARIAEQLT